MELPESPVNEEIGKLNLLYETQTINVWFIEYYY